MSEFASLRGTFSSWLRERVSRGTKIIVSGGWRRIDSAEEAFHSDKHLPLFEIWGGHQETVRIRIPDRFPLQESISGSTPLSPARFSKGNDSQWWDGWAAVLAATGLIPPLVDPKVLALLLAERRRLRFCCDTNALAKGVLAWLLLVFDGRADMVTSAVVDRELSAWPDRFPQLWRARTTNLWHLRTGYKLARRITETPPPHTVVDRLSPEQSALMLAKFRDEGSGKSPDADMLLIELARELVRDQPQNARVVYLTGDRNNARSATSALGWENVLFATADQRNARRFSNQVVPRGWYHPGRPLGTILMQTTAEFLWSVLAACDFVVLEFVQMDGIITKRALLRGAVRAQNGVPSDWADPWLQIDEEPEQMLSTSGSAGNQAASSPPDPAPPVVQIPIAETIPAADPSLPPSGTSGPVEPMRETTSNLETSGTSLSADENPFQKYGQELSVLLSGPPSEVELLNLPSSYLPFPTVIFGYLSSALGLTPAFETEGTSKVSLEYGRAILLALGAIDSESTPGPRIEEFRSAWLQNRLDWFHGEFMRLAGYRASVECLRDGLPVKSLTSRQRDHLTMARILGQVARMPAGSGSLLIRGDAGIRTNQLTSALERWFPARGTTHSTFSLCHHAAHELALTPYRFERAMIHLWQQHPDLALEAAPGGTVEPGPEQRILVLDQKGWSFKSVAPGALAFGYSGPINFVTRNQ